MSSHNIRIVLKLRQCTASYIYLYVQPLGGIRDHSIQFHHYADDLQLYAHFDLNKSSLESTISRMQDCICNVQSWLSNNKLKMNPDKTLFIAFVPPYYNTLVDNININIGSSDINVVSSVTNLGVRLDRNLKMTTQNITSNELLYLSTKAM